MDIAELRRFKVDLLDEIHELGTEPVADLEGVRRKVEDFFSKLEAESGKEEG